MPGRGRLLTGLEAAPSATLHHAAAASDAAPQRRGLRATLEGRAPARAADLAHRATIIPSSTAITHPHITTPLNTTTP